MDQTCWQRRCTAKLPTCTAWPHTSQRSFMALCALSMPISRRKTMDVALGLCLAHSWYCLLRNDNRWSVVDAGAPLHEPQLSEQPNFLFSTGATLAGASQLIGHAVKIVIHNTIHCFKNIVWKGFFFFVFAFSEKKTMEFFCLVPFFFFCVFGAQTMQAAINVCKIGVLFVHCSVMARFAARPHLQQIWPFAWLVLLPETIWTTVPTASQLCWLLSQSCRCTNGACCDWQLYFTATAADSPLACARHVRCLLELL